MSDYVPCRACGGKGLISLEDYERVTAHIVANSRARRQGQQEMDRLRKEAVAGAALRRVTEAGERQRELEALVYGSPPPA